MQKLRLINLLIVFCFLLSLSVGVHAQEEGTPDFSLMEYKTGRKHSFRDILTSRANVMLVTSTICGSCISELKAMDQIRAKYRGDMSVTAVFVDRTGESRVFRYLDYYKFDLDRFLVDPGGAVPARFEAPTVPTMIMFDRKGNELFRKVGFADGDESLIIDKAEEIMYGKKQDASTFAKAAADKGRGTPLEQARDRRNAAGNDEEAPTAEPGSARSTSGVRKTTGCASTG